MVSSLCGWNVKAKHFGTDERTEDETIGWITRKELHVLGILGSLPKLDWGKPFHRYLGSKALPWPDVTPPGNKAQKTGGCLVLKPKILGSSSSGKKGGASHGNTMLTATKRAGIPVQGICFVRDGLCDGEKQLMPRLMIRVSREGSHM